MCHIPDPGPIISEEARDVIAHVEKTIGFSLSSSLKRRHPLGKSVQRQNTSKPCPIGERAAASYQTSTDHRVASPERR
ncbi:hypothetical protein Bca4012_064236 [Brassica carinata]